MEGSTRAPRCIRWMPYDGRVAGEEELRRGTKSIPKSYKMEDHPCCMVVNFEGTV